MHHENFINLLNFEIMKKIIAILAGIMAFSSVMSADDDRAVTFEQLPAPAQEFIRTNFPSEKISYATVESDFFCPDYKVMLVNGIKIEFDSKGTMKKIESKYAGLDEKFIPAQIKAYVSEHFPGVYYLEYDKGRRDHEVKLSNRLELKFDLNFNLIDIDD